MRHEPGGSLSSRPAARRPGTLRADEDLRQEHQPGVDPRPAGSCRDHHPVCRYGSRSPLRRGVCDLPDLQQPDPESDSRNSPRVEHRGADLYWARYTWATLADKLGVSEKEISKGLGHVDTSIAGKFYISYDWTKVDRANRTVLDYLSNMAIHQ